jgi:hypothetical protein
MTVSLTAEKDTSPSGCHCTKALELLPVIHSHVKTQMS